LSSAGWAFGEADPFSILLQPGRSLRAQRRNPDASANPGGWIASSLCSSQGRFFGKGVIASAAKRSRRRRQSRAPEPGSKCADIFFPIFKKLASLGEAVLSGPAKIHNERPFNKRISRLFRPQTTEII
jgi:hypothetical protein